MTLRSILVPMAGDEADVAALTVAGLVATRHNAHVRALFAEPDSRDIPMAMVGDAAGGYLSRDLVKTLETRIESRRAVAEQSFNRWRGQSGLAFAQAPGGAMPSADFTRAVGTDAIIVRNYGLVADIIVTLLPKAAEVERSVFIESGLFEAGRPVLAVPQRGGGVLDLEAPMQIAWRPAAVSIRALRSALPFLTASRDVVVSQAVDEGEAPVIESVIEYLAWHGIKARGLIHRAPRDGARLLSEATKMGVGLLVLGAYLRSRAHALVFGGVTRHVLENATMPVLFAH